MEGSHVVCKECRKECVNLFQEDNDLEMNHQVSDKTKIKDAIQKAIFFKVKYTARYKWK